MKTAIAPSSFIIEAYLFGFNGQEKDNDIAGAGNHLNFAARGYDPCLGRFWTIDPLAAKFPWQSAYVFADNSPIWKADQEGKYGVPKGMEAAYQQQYPMLMKYLAENIHSDMMKNTKALNAYQEIRGTNSGYDARKHINYISTWGQGPSISFVANPGGIPGHGHYDPESDGIEFSSKDAKNIESVLQSNASMSAKQGALLMFFETIGHETAHKVNHPDKVMEYGEDVSDLKRGAIEYKGGEVGYWFDQKVWGNGTYRPNDRATNPSSTTNQTMYDPGVVEGVVSEAQKTEGGRETLPTVPTR